ncbi:GNAT family N-acetyltransferase [Aggregatibacter aphrophilus]|jgi:wecD protein|uniref:GNAT family N-acetyltransferase n=1 Tax=Aggregatibacter kilianii TaxID=2025884 RepID=UPI000D699A2A|nr:GNAT family N-acetyltransferase [Aggregatibacter kilianii]RDF02232.1 GNAT family N-acetyltransferase [Aggregatibacter aphrophilus]
MIKIFKAEQWNLDILLPLFEEYRLSHGMAENPERTLTFLTNRIRFSESIFFLALDEDKKAVGFIQLYPRLSSLQLQRYWQLTDIFVRNISHKNDVYTALISKAKEFVSYTQSTRLTVEQDIQRHHLLENEGFKLNPKKSVFELNLVD